MENIKSKEKRMGIELLEKKSIERRSEGSGRIKSFSTREREKR